jgi:hypothetical protein
MLFNLQKTVMESSGSLGPCIYHLGDLRNCCTALRDMPCRKSSCYGVLITQVWVYYGLFETSKSGLTEIFWESAEIFRSGQCASFGDGSFCGTVASIYYCGNNDGNDESMIWRYLDLNQALM